MFTPRFEVVFLCSMLAAGCASTRSARAPAAIDAESVPTRAWYDDTRPLAHYHLAILNDDVERMREWLARGYSADTKVSPVHPSAIQLALSLHRREIIRLLLDNPRVEARPDPRRHVDLCPATRDHVTVSLYDFVVFEDANRVYANTCLAEDYYVGRDRQEENLVVTEDTVFAFTGLAVNERSPELFRIETKGIRRALKASRATTGRGTPNDRVLEFIENY